MVRILSNIMIKNRSIVMNGALDEAMEIMKGSLADNSQVENPYETKGKIFLDENDSIVSIYINGIIVNFDWRNYK